MVTDYTDRAIPVSARDTLQGTLETVDDGVILREMAGQWKAGAHAYQDGIAATARVGVPIMFVFYRGNPHCDFAEYISEGFHRGMKCEDDPYAPGIIFEPSQEANFDAFVDSLAAILNDPRVGGNPYDIQIVKADTSDIGNYVQVVNGGWYPKNNVVFVRRQG